MLIFPYDVWYLFKSIICTLIIIITLVRIEGLMTDVHNASLYNAYSASNRRLSLREYSNIAWEM